MKHSGRAVLAILLSVLSPGTGLVYLGDISVGSLLAMTTQVATALTAFVPVFFPATPAAWAYDSISLVVAMLWVMQLARTLWFARAMARGEIAETKLPIAVALVCVGFALLSLTHALRPYFGVTPFAVPAGTHETAVLPGDRVLVRGFPADVKAESLRGRLVVYQPDARNAENIVVTRVKAVDGAFETSSVLGYPWVIWFSKEPGGAIRWERIGKEVP